MSTVRTAIKQAMRLLKAIAPGDDPTADEYAVGLEGAQSLVLALHEARGPLLELDITANTTPGEEQRLRVASGSPVVTLPTSVAINPGYNPYDYGFELSPAYTPQTGTTAAADGIQWRSPRDGARIEVIASGASTLSFYRADTGAWATATGLTLDSELPLNARYTGDFAAVLAERLADVLSNAEGPTKAQMARIMTAREALFSRPGTRRDPVRAEYL